MNRSYFPELTEEVLVISALLGNLEAFDELVRRFRPAVVMVAEQILRSRSAAEDVAQETFLLAFKALPKLQNPAAFAGWLCAIARNRSRRVAAKESRQTSAEPSQLDRMLLTHCRELVANPSEDWERQHERDCIRAAMEQLPFAFAAVLQLYYFEEWPVARIADFHLLTTTTVKWRLHQGRLLLRKQLLLSEEPTHV